MAFVLPYHTIGHTVVGTRVRSSYLDPTSALFESFAIKQQCAQDRKKTRIKEQQKEIAGPSKKTLSLDHRQKVRHTHIVNHVILQRKAIENNRQRQRQSPLRGESQCRRFL